VDPSSASASSVDVAAAATRPIGGYKGFALGLGLEILASALSGAAVLTEVKSMLREQSAPANVGHFFLAIDPARMSGSAFRDAIGRLLAILAESEEHVPGRVRHARHLDRARRLVLSHEQTAYLTAWSRRFHCPLEV
jgi:(2R)-3-sulfolactate dehydrogenase (NADP+)